MSLQLYVLTTTPSLQTSSLTGLAFKCTYRRGESPVKWIPKISDAVHRRGRITDIFLRITPASHSHMPPLLYDCPLGHQSLRLYCALKSFQTPSSEIMLNKQITCWRWRGLLFKALENNGAKPSNLFSHMKMLMHYAFSQCVFLLQHWSQSVPFLLNLIP